MSPTTGIARVLALIAIAGSLAPAHAQAERFALRFQLRAGETLQYQHVFTSTETLERDQQRHETRTETEGVQTIRVVGAADAWTDLELRMELRRVIVNGETRTPPRDPAQRIRMDLDGFLVDEQSGAASDRDVFLLLPKRPISVGESWGRTDRRPGPGPSSEMQETYQVIRVETGPLGRVARIRGRMTFAGNGFAVEGQPGARANVRESIDIETDWLIDRGRVLRSRADARSELEAFAEGQVATPFVRETITSSRTVEAVTN